MDVRTQIHVKNRKTGEKHLYRLDQERVVIGRDQSNYIVLDGKTISRRHTEILKEGHQFFVRDLKSNNGTLLNEKKLPPQEKALLRSGDMIQIEEYDLQFRIPNADEVEDIHEITDTDLLEVKMVKKLLKAMDRDNAPSLEVLDGPQAGHRFAFEGKNQDVAIGRDPACEFMIDSDVISRKHARLEKRFDTVVLYDLNSKNGTFVNRVRIQEQSLKDGDIIHLGTLAVSFRNPQELSFDFEPPHIHKAGKPDLPSDQKKSETQLEAEAPPFESKSPSSSLPQARSARRRDGEPKKPEPVQNDEIPLEDPPETPQEVSPDSPPTSEGNAEDGKFRLSAMEAVAIAVGLIVLVGSIWGILKLLG